MKVLFFAVALFLSAGAGAAAVTAVRAAARVMIRFFSMSNGVYR